MRIEQGSLAHMFLADEKFAIRITNTLNPKPPINGTEQEQIVWANVWKITLDMFSPKNQKAYYITNTVIDKLDMLKIGTNKDLDWNIVAKAMTHNKCTYILPDSTIVRVYKYQPTRLGFALLRMDKTGHVSFTSGIAFLDTNTVSTNLKSDPYFLNNEMLIFKIMCFLYLTENEEQVIEPYSKAGTRKSGKVINRSPVPITVVTSKWNITSVRTEGFMVSGHFRLQPTKQGHKMIYIEPFQKHGYVRRASKENE